MYQLVRFNEINEDQYNAFIANWNIKDERIIPGAAQRTESSFRQQLAKWEDDEKPEVTLRGFVPSTLFFCIDKKGTIVGAIHLRHFLNENLKMHGGHIGYGVIPIARGRGVATWMLRRLLTLIKNQYHEVLVTCDDDNKGSYKTIENCGGKLAQKIEWHGTMTRHYWINLDR